MRSPILTPGRNTAIEKIWRWLSSWSKTPIEGSQRNNRYWNFVDDNTLFGRNYDLEIHEGIVRGDDNCTRARELVYIKHHCAIIGQAIDILTDAIMSSADGDDQGFAIGETRNDNVTPVNPVIKDIADNLIMGVLSRGVLDQIPQNFLMYGDAFLSLGLSDTGINRVLVLPTWEMFRIEDSQGELLGYEQRTGISDYHPIPFHPLTCVHWRYRKDVLYGRSLFHESIDDALQLIDTKKNLGNAATITAINPRVHEFSCDATSEEVEIYKQAYLARLSKGPIFDYYTPQGQNIRPFSDTPPNIDALLKYKDSLLKDIGNRSRIPPWLIGLETVGAREIAGEPSKFFALYINRLRAIFSMGLRHIIDLEIAWQQVKGRHNVPKEEWEYRLIFPKFYINPVTLATQPESEEMNKNTVEDLDSQSVIKIPSQVIDYRQDSEVRKCNNIESLMDMQ